MSYESDLREYEREQAREDEHWLDEQIEAAVAAERARCLEIVELVCLCRYVKAAHSRALAAAARGKGLPDLSDAHLDRLLDVSALAEEITKLIRGET